MLNVFALSLSMAKKMAEAAEQTAKNHNIKIAIAIMDNHGNLKYFSRMDGNNFMSVRMAPLKAMTAASIPIPTESLAERNSSILNGPYIGVPGVVLLEGGVPIITKSGDHIGAIGISGANPQLDGICARAAIAAIENEL